jgi:hypothetical protein
MISRKFKIILYATLAVMILHIAEEFMTQLYSVDPLTLVGSRYLHMSPIVVYSIVQVLGVLFISILAWISARNKFNKQLSIILGLLFIFELFHPYMAILNGSYYPGLYTGTILVVIGCFYWKEFLKLQKLT